MSLKKEKIKAARVFKTASVILAGLCCCYAAVLSVLMYRQAKKLPSHPKTVIVLGCRVRGSRPSKMLTNRINAAAKLLSAHPDALCIASGGKGEGEGISEARCIKRELIARGIDGDRIFTEDKSTSTWENLTFSKKIIDREGMSHDITIATSEFHEFRAGLMAKKIFGSDNITAFPSHTQQGYRQFYWVREWLGVGYYLLFGK